MLDMVKERWDFCNALGLDRLVSHPALNVSYLGTVNFTVTFYPSTPFFDNIPALAFPMPLHKLAYRVSGHP
jgi:hypothetical protein